MPSHRDQLSKQRCCQSALGSPPKPWRPKRPSSNCKTHSHSHQERDRRTQHNCWTEDGLLVWNFSWYKEQNLQLSAKENNCFLILDQCFRLYIIYTLKIFLNLGDAEPWRENGLKWQSVYSFYRSVHWLGFIVLQKIATEWPMLWIFLSISLSKYIVHVGTCIFVNKRKGEKLNSINNIFGEPIIYDNGSHFFLLYALTFPLRPHHRGEQTLELELILWSSHTTWNHSSWLCWVYLHSCTK